MKKIFFVVAFFTTFFSFSQVEDDSILELSEYLGYLKKYHPIIKQARLKTTEGEIKLLKARGAFDPKIEVDYDKKKFKKKDYFDKLNASFKIPTWYGIEFKANYEDNSGIFLNPELTVPENGLYSAGVSISLARGLLTNERMATLRMAKVYTRQAQADQQLAINDILYKAIDTYFEWLKSYQTQQTYQVFLRNASDRLSNVKNSFIQGDKPAIDTLEANINLNNRILDLEKSKLMYIKSKLKLANFLWLQDNIPLELEDSIIPDVNTYTNIDSILELRTLDSNKEIVNRHLKIQSLELKKESLLIDKRLKLNNLLPKIDFNYNFITSKYQDITNFDTSNYKAGLNVSVPLFLRKERSDLRLAKLKLKDMDFSIAANKVNLSNKINSIRNEINSYENQTQLLGDLVDDYKRLVRAEERMFTLGEGSLFRINYREVKLIETQLKAIDTRYKYLNSKASLQRLINNQSYN